MKLLLIIGGILLRLVPHPPNFAPIAATALFGGVHLKKRYAILLPLAMMVVSDYLLLYINPFAGPAGPVADFSRVRPLTDIFNPIAPYVWGSFAISGLIGLLLRRRYRASNVALASVAGSLQFYLITNFGVWAGGMYARGFDGLATSYLMGLPFLKWTLLGDLFFTGVFFGCYELAKRPARVASTAPIEIQV